MRETWAVPSTSLFLKIKTALKQTKPCPYAEVIAGCRWMFRPPLSPGGYQSSWILSPSWNATRNPTRGSCSILQVTLVKNLQHKVSNLIIWHFGRPTSFSPAFHVSSDKSIMPVFTQLLWICITIPEKENWLFSSVLASCRGPIISCQLGKVSVGLCVLTHWDTHARFYNP